uniref:Gem-associated protein 6-like n=1 Tax=Phallusia mammillata TaxID=59560 RepID=A0A6F9DDG6_9ASCI|nr:gem-associated protein 6-like [Phallusia mammillata]
MDVKWSGVHVTFLKQFLNKKIIISLFDKSEIGGWVYTIDVLTKSVVLLQEQRLTFVHGHAIECVVICEETDVKPPIFEEIFKENQPLLKKYEIEDRKIRLCRWFETNMLPVKVLDEKLVVAGSVEVLPPYNEHSCVTSNQIILTRIQKLISQMTNT